MTILVVDDSRAMRVILIRALREAGYKDHTFIEAADGKSAHDIIKTSRPNLVLCDWNMPIMSGIDLLQTLRAENNPVQFGFVTSDSSEGNRDLALASGALFLITKPFTPEALRAAMDRVGS